MIKAGQVAAMLKRGFPLEEQTFLRELLAYTLKGRNAKVFFGYPADTVKTLLAWHLHKRTLVYHRNNMGEIDGLLTWHRTDGNWTVEDVKNWRQDDPTGDTFLFSIAMADNTDVKRQGLWSFIQREPDVLVCDVQALRPRHGEITIIPYSKRTLTRILKGK